MSQRTIAVVGAVAVAALVLTSCSGGGGTASGNNQLDVDLSNLATTTEPGTAPIDEVTWNLPYEPLSIDPMLSFNYAENTVDANLCDSLLRLNPDLTTGPGLAESVDMPDDTTVVYSIRNDVSFWDGTPLTAADVVYSLARQSGEHNGDSYFGEYLTSVESVEQTGEHEVTVHLSEPDALFNQAMATAAGAIVSQAFAESAGPAFGTPQGGLMCTGPFSLESWSAGKSIVLAKNPNYWDESLIPKAEKLSFTFIADETTAVNALRAGDVDGQYFYLPPTGLNQLQGDSGATTTFGKSFVYFTLAGANQEGPFANPTIRQALLLAIDRQAIADVVFQGAAAPAPTLAGPDFWGDQAAIYEPAFAEFDVASDPEEAKRLIEGLPEAGETITIAVQGSSAVHEQTANLIQAAGESIGLKIETKVIPVEQYGNMYYDPAAREGIDAFFTTWYGNVTDPLDVYAVFTTDGASNFGNYTGVNDAVAEARATLDDEARAQLTVDIQQQVTEELPWLPLTYMPPILVQSDRISGATASIAYLYYPWAATIGGVE
ncbi:ABC transporter substrate-binding protein [Leucobacter denitrificans]|uniref:ABC transporter substrate-binding protein n=1 Tax=Leucobacter denitrificans TaxID=683042 RepID=A0A7G9S2C8_9MICO|nr:ABC transporter substrate-binding protein [Leucobacter denitrificans]QNN62003.1 ABC transporter substrate-binding protein [Leucobacter denitrificans]